MKTIPIALHLELTRSLSRLATCMRIVRTDGNIYGFTTANKSLTVSGLLYLPAASFNPTDIASANNLDTDNLTVEGFLSSDAITEDDLRAGRWDYASFRIFQVNWASPTDGEKKDRAGHLGQVTVHRQTFVAELLGLMEAYATSIGYVTQPLCRNIFGDSRCGVVLNGSPLYTVNGTIDTAASDFFTMTDAARTEPDGTFDEGVITFNSGQAQNLSYEIKSYLLAGGTMVTKTPMAYNVAGASYTMTYGCGHRLLEDCVARYNNGRRFNGEPWLRGNDVLIQGGRRQS